MKKVLIVDLEVNIYKIISLNFFKYFERFARSIRLVHSQIYSKAIDIIREDKEIAVVVVDLGNPQVHYKSSFELIEFALSNSKNLIVTTTQPNPNLLVYKDKIDKVFIKMYDVRDLINQLILSANI